MPRLTLDEVHEALPKLEELRPVFDHLMAVSEPDPERVWSGSGRLGTLGARLVPGGSLAAAASQLADTEGARLGELYAATARALEALGSDDRAAAALALLDAAALEERHERHDRAEAFAEAAYRAARDSRDQGPAALSLRRWARAARSQGKLGDAIERYEHAYTAARAIADPRGAAEAAVGAGNVLEEQGRWSEAAEWYRSALETLEGVDARAPERWHAMLNLHIVARSRGAIAESLSWLDRAEQAAAADPDGARPFIGNARGQLAMARGNFGEAEVQLQMALEATSSARARVTIRLNLAEALLAQGRTLDAAEHAREAERDSIHAGLVPKLPEVYRLLGRIASADGDPDAFVLFERALEIARSRGLPALEEAVTLQAYAEAEASRGNQDAARQLGEMTKNRFAALGMIHAREAWADVFGQPGSGVSHQPEEESDDG
jgi:tetratricopeptide (TPR) repeat protein